MHEGPHFFAKFILLQTMVKPKLPHDVPMLCKGSKTKKNAKAHTPAPYNYRLRWLRISSRVTGFNFLHAQQEATPSNKILSTRSSMVPGWYCVPNVSRQ